ncbi:MAG: YfhO family protein, partial [Candidatus Kapaibacterium sp.]
LLVTLAALLVYYFLKRKISPLIVAVGILALTVIDLWRIDSRPMEIVSRDEYQSNLETHDYIQFIQQDTSLFRVEDMNETQPSNKLVSYGLQTPAGYHAAKMREFQDVVDETGHEQGNGIFNPFMWNLLNTKYIIANGGISNDRSRFIPAFVSKEPPQQQENSKESVPTIVWLNPEMLPRAFFAYRWEVKPKLDILHAMDSGAFNPRDVVYFDEAPKGMPALAPTPIDTTTEKLTMEYKNEDVTIHTKTAGNRLLFMSDTWYPDWHATIDGKPTPIYRADYAFRAIAIPAGQHELTLTYYDPHYVAGRTISLTTNALALIGLGIGITGFSFSRRRKRPEVEVIPPA